MKRLEVGELFMRVGMFDSGVGGLTVLKTLINKYPDNEYVYYGDTLNLPYGNKDINKLQELSSNCIDFLLKKNVDMIIIACGTISSNCLSYLKNKYSIPIYDIITPTVDYINNSDYDSIGVIATDKTIDSHIFKNKIKKNVYEIASPKFVPLIEEDKLYNIDKVIDEYLNKYKDKIDLLVLGCTHYPIIKEDIVKYLSNDIDVLDMSYVLNLNLLSTGQEILIYFSYLNDDIIYNTKRILNIDNININEV